MFDTKAPPKIRNLSVSKIEKFMLCPKNFELSYIHKIPQTNAWKPFAGTVVHEIIEMAIREFAKSGVYPRWQDMDDRYEPVWKEKVEETEAKDSFIGWQDDPKDPLETLKPDYRKLIRVAREDVLPSINPWMLDGAPVVEHRIDLEVRTKIGPCPIIGYADLLDASGVLIDWKSTGDEVSKRAKGTWLQFAAYSLWAYPLVGEENLRCEKIFLVRGKGNPHAERVPFTVGEKHREYFVKLAAQVWEIINMGIFIANPDTWLCNPTFCSYFHGCMSELKKKEEELCPETPPIA